MGKKLSQGIMATTEEKLWGHNIEILEGYSVICYPPNIKPIEREKVPVQKLESQKDGLRYFDFINNA